MYQKLTLIGHLGGDPELKYMPNGNGVCNFSVAVNNSYTDRNGEKVTETAWFRIAVWNKLAESCNQYLSRGKKVYIEGTLDFDKETGTPKTYIANDGATKSSFNVTGQVVRFLSDFEPNSEHDSQGASEQKSKKKDDDFDDVPF